jgi:hypothetical protein
MHPELALESNGLSSRRRSTCVTNNLTRNKESFHSAQGTGASVWNLIRTTLKNRRILHLQLVRWLQTIRQVNLHRHLSRLNLDLHLCRHLHRQSRNRKQHLHQQRVLFWRQASLLQCHQLHQVGHQEVNRRLFHPCHQVNQSCHQLHKASFLSAVGVLNAKYDKVQERSRANLNAHFCESDSDQTSVSGETLKVYQICQGRCSGFPAVQDTGVLDCTPLLN